MFSRISKRMIDEVIDEEKIVNITGGKDRICIHLHLGHKSVMKLLKMKMYICSNNHIFLNESNPVNMSFHSP